MGKYSLNEFVQKTQQDQLENDFFELETERVLEVNLNGEVWAKMGSMISYVGAIKVVFVGMDKRRNFWMEGARVQ